MTEPEILIPAVVPPSAPEAQAEAAVQEAQTLISAPFLGTIKTQVDYNQNAAFIASLKAKAKELEEKRTAITGPINKSLKAINDLFRGPADLIQQTIQKVEWPMKVYIREQDRLRQEAEAKERQRLADERAEQDRIRAEAEAKLEEARLAVDAAQEAVAAETNPFLAASKAAAVEAAQATVQEVSSEITGAIRETARIDHAPIEVAAVPQVRAAGTRVNRPWKWEYENKEEIERQFLVPNEALINATVRAMKGDTKIKGIRVFQDISIGGR